MPSRPITGQLKLVAVHLILCFQMIDVTAQSDIIDSLTDQIKTIDKSENPSVVYYYKAWRDMADQKYEIANGRFTRLVRKQPNTIYGYYGRANNSLLCGKIEEAKRDIDHILEKPIDEPEFYDLAGKIYLANQEPEQAKGYFLKALALNTSSSKGWIDMADTYTNLGLCYLQIVKNDSASWYLNKSIALKPHNPIAYYFLGLHGIQENSLTQACNYLNISEFQGSSITDNIRAYCKDAPAKELDTEALTSTMLDAQIYTDTIYINKWGRWTNRENAHYTRLAAFDVQKNSFYGNFKDFNLSGNLIFSGFYDKEGKLHALFNAYYSKGSLKVCGNYVKGERLGIWEYYDSLNNLTHKVKYLHHDLEMIESYDRNGNMTLTKGKGYFSFIDDVNGSTLEIKGAYKRGKKEGVWEWYDEHGELRREEVFKKGVFKKAENTIGFDPHPKTFSLIGWWISLSQKFFDNSEEAKLSWQVRKSDYPFAKHIPPHGSRQELTTFYHAQDQKNSVSKEVDGKDEIYTIVEKQPEFLGGMTAFYAYASDNLTYPDEARLNGIQGRVFIQFVVDEQGNTTDVRCVKGIGYGCDEVAVKVIEAANIWTPGTQKGIPVKVRMVLPITFNLSDKNHKAGDPIRDF